MQIVRSLRVASMMLSLAACAGGGVSAQQKPATEPAAPSPADKAVASLASLASERLGVADRVAASKWGTDKPIDDPPREKQVLDDMAKRASEMGVDSEAVQRIFRDQIEANKLVQRGLHQQWAAAPATAPTTRPDLAKEVRPALDRIGGDLLTAIRDAQPVLTSPQCAASVERARAQTATSLDELHRQGLERALQHACNGAP
ncbi:chorismate mutase [Pendulispora rubella]|uniref:Chorismate mutase n=1 Tax=Pendulispora rubella TaxID=2741070 RepID=A0ABZ2L307_9BACT